MRQLATSRRVNMGRRVAIVLVGFLVASSLASVHAQDPVEVALDAAIAAFERGDLKRAGGLPTIVRLRPESAIAH